MALWQPTKDRYTWTTPEGDEQTIEAPYASFEPDHIAFREQDGTLIRAIRNKDVVELRRTPGEVA